MDNTGFLEPSIAYSALLPLLIVFGAAVVMVGVEAFAPRAHRWTVQAVLAIGSLAAAFVALVVDDSGDIVTAGGALVIDGPGRFLMGAVLLLALVSIVYLAERSQDAAGSAFVAQAATVPGSPEERTEVVAAPHTEVFPLVMFAVAGMLLFPVSHDLVTLFVALETLSLPLYLLCGLARRRRLLSQEAAMKYFLLGAFSSAFFLYGAALVYGFAGTTNLDGIAVAAGEAARNDALLYGGMALLGVGLLFKVSAVPFQAWTPDVYQGAPTPITALMASCTKVAAFGALLRLFWVSFGPLEWDWQPVLGGVAVLTMVVGAIFAVTQTDVKRMLAYSSVAHAGFILVGVVALSEQGLGGTMFYLVAYGLPTIGAFVIVSLVRDAQGEATHLSKWAGLGRRSPLVAGLFSLFLLALAGIPFTSGFIGKFAVFSAAAADDHIYLVIVGVLASAITAFFYVRVIVLMFFHESTADSGSVSLPGVLTSGALTVSGVATVALGVVPGPLLDLARNSALFLQ